MLFRFFFFFKQKTAYELRISDWSSDVCSSDLVAIATDGAELFGTGSTSVRTEQDLSIYSGIPPLVRSGDWFAASFTLRNGSDKPMKVTAKVDLQPRSEEHTSELQSLMRISYAVFCLKKNKKTKIITNKQ